MDPESNGPGEEALTKTQMLLIHFQRWELMEPLIRQQDLCLAISAFAPGSKVKMEPCSTKEARQVRRSIFSRREECEGGGALLPPRDPSLPARFITTGSS